MIRYGLRVALLCIVGVTYFSTLASGGSCVNGRNIDVGGNREVGGNRNIVHVAPRGNRDVGGNRDIGGNIDEKIIQELTDIEPISLFGDNPADKRQSERVRARKYIDAEEKLKTLEALFSKRRHPTDEMEEMYKSKLEIFRQILAENMLEGQGERRSETQERMKNKPLVPKRKHERKQSELEIYRERLSKNCGGEEYTPITYERFDEMSVKEMKRIVIMQVQCSDTKRCFDADSLYNWWKSNAENCRAFVDPVRNVPFKRESLEELKAVVGERKDPTPPVWSNPYKLKLSGDLRIMDDDTNLTVEYKYFWVTRGNEEIHLQGSSIPVKAFINGEVTDDWSKMATEVTDMVLLLAHLQRLYENNDPNRPKYHLNKNRLYWTGDFTRGWAERIPALYEKMISELRAGLSDQPGYESQC